MTLIKKMQILLVLISLSATANQPDAYRQRECHEFWMHKIGEAIDEANSQTSPERRSAFDALVQTRENALEYCLEHGLKESQRVYSFSY